MKFHFFLILLLICSCRSNISQVRLCEEGRSVSAHDIEASQRILLFKHEFDERLFGVRVCMNVMRAHMRPEI